MVNELILIGSFLVIVVFTYWIMKSLIAGRRLTLKLTQEHSLLEENLNNSSEAGSKNMFLKTIALLIPQFPNEVLKIDKDLKRAGYYQSTALIEYLGIRNGFILGISILTGTLAATADPKTSFPQTILLTGLVIIILGYGLPRLVLHWFANQRVARIQKGLPDALDLIKMCLSGGLGLRQSLRRVSQEIEYSHPDVAIEFEIIRKQAEADSLANALKNFAQRIETANVSTLASIVSQTDRLGTHVGQAICDYADSVRQMYRQHAEEQSNRTSIKLLFPVVLCLAPPIFILLCGPLVIKGVDFLKQANQPGGILSQTTEE